MGGSISPTNIVKKTISPVASLTGKGLSAIGLDSIGKYADPKGLFANKVLGGSSGDTSSGANYGLSNFGEMSTNDNGYQTIGGGINRYGEARPDTALMRNADGQLHDDFRMSMGSAYQNLQDKAMTEGDTQSATLARQQQDLMAQQSKDALNRQSGTQLASGMQNLAMRGGAGIGSRERMNRDVSRNQMSGMQGIGQENRLANLGISMQDEAMKNSLLGQVGQNQQMIQEGNIGRLQSDLNTQNLALHNLYSEDMQALGAQQSAAAQAAAGKSQSLMDKVF